MRYPADLLARIRDELARLYVERGDILRVLDEAGIAQTAINLEQKPVNVWARIVDEANHLGLVRQLLAVALRQYASGPVGMTLLELVGALNLAEQAARSRAPQGEKNGRAA